MADEGDKAPVVTTALGGNHSGEPPASKVTASRPPNGNQVLAVLALLLALLAVVAAGYLGWLTWQEHQRAGEQTSELGTLRLQLNDRLGALTDKVDRTGQQAAAHNGQRIDQLVQTVSTLRQQLAALRDTDRDQWKLAEVEYLLRLASQRLQLGGELDSAQALLESADNILKQLGYADLMPVRRQLAEDLAAVRAATRVDRDGIYLRLAAVGDQIAKLSFYGMPAVPESVPAPPSQPQSWSQRLARGWHEALAALRGLVVVRHHRVDAQPLLGEAEEQALRAGIELLLEQAKTAVLHARQPVYHDSLGHAETLVERWFRADDPATQSVLAELKQLYAVDVTPSLPDISQSQHVIKAYIDGLHQRILPAAGTPLEVP